METTTKKKIAGRNQTAAIFAQTKKTNQTINDATSPWKMGVDRNICRNNNNNNCWNDREALIPSTLQSRRPGTSGARIGKRIECHIKDHVEKKKGPFSLAIDSKSAAWNVPSIAGQTERNPIKTR